ncbi:MAG: GTPase Era [Ureaplasma sp.]|nr:GTPase Era [Ureaplasma sp.]
MKKFTGKITIIGKPNVGKSSLLNALVDNKISIVNKKPQATRNNVLAILESDEYYLQILDTPGFHKEHNKLDTFLNSQVKQSLKDADLIYFLVDPTRPLNEEDHNLLKILKNLDIPKILVITKSDLIKLDKIQNLINDVNKINEFNYSVSINIYDAQSLKKLLDLSQSFLNLTESWIEEKTETINDDLFLIKEIIREQCMNLLQYEIPYGISIMIDYFNYDSTKKTMFIDASINVEKESHKKIVIGHNGEMIKTIGKNSRLEILKIYDTKVFLKLFVKVSKNWRNNLTKLKEFGYSN